MISILTLSATFACAPDPISVETSARALMRQNDGFYFYPPLAPSTPTYSGTFDATLLPNLSVLLDGIDAGGVTRSSVTFTSATATPITLNAAGQTYSCNILARTYFLDSTLTYRARVLLSGNELGYADVPSSIFALLGSNPNIVVTVRFRAETRAAPTLASVTPASITAGAADTTLTLTGTGFVHDSVARRDGTNLATTWISSSQLTAVVPASALTVGGTSNILVFTPSPGGGSSAAQVFTVSNAAPTITALSPATVPMGATDTLVTIDGTGFVSGAVASANGASLATTYVSATRVTAVIPAAMFVAPATLAVTVLNPAPTTGPSASFALSCIALTAQLTSVSPSRAFAGLGARTVTLSGSSFQASAVAAFDGNPLVTTFVSSTELRATIPAALAATPGAHDLTVVNPGTAASSPAILRLAQLDGPPRRLGAGDWHACALHDDGTVWCEGLNSFGQLGTGDYEHQYSGPIPVTTLSGVAQIGVGLSHTCAILADASVSCWGGTDASDGTSLHPNPTAVPGLSDVTQLTLGNAYSCALRADGTVWCWGENTWGTLGNGTTTNSVVPVRVQGLTDVREIRSGQYHHTCAVTTGGNVWCWGWNGAGNLGVSSQVAYLSTTPVQVPGISTAVSLGIGLNHSCALLDDGTVKCWGENSFAQLGQGNLTSSVAPLTVQNLANVTGLSAGEYSTCAVLEDRTARCWGYNYYGQLGDGTTTTRSLPVVAQGLGNVAEIAGYIVRVARLNDGTYRGWGTGVSVAPNYGLTPQPADLASTTVQPYLQNTFPTAIDPLPQTNVDVYGARFLPGAIVTLDGVPLTTNYRSTVQLTAVVPASQFPAGARTLAVHNTTFGALSTSSGTLTIRNQRCDVVSVTPSEIPVGSPDTQITVRGSGFIAGAVVTYSGGVLATTLVSPTELTAIVPRRYLERGEVALIGAENLEPHELGGAVVHLNVVNPAPTLTSVQPSGSTVGAPALDVTIDGAAFYPYASATLGGVALTTTYVSPTRLVARVPATSLATARTLSLTVTNAAPNAGPSAPLTYAVSNPSPTITALSPASEIATRGPITLTVTGANFVSGAVASWEGTDLATTFVSASELTAVVPASLLLSVGNHPVTVTNPAPSLGASAPLSFQVSGAPVLTSLAPSTVLAGSADLQLTLSGENFVAGATAYLDGTSLVTSFVSTTELAALVPATLLSSAGSRLITVENPTWVGASGALTLVVNNPAPTITALTPSSGTVADAPLTLTVSGSNFVSGAVVDFGGTALATTFVSPTQLTAIVPAAQFSPAGTQSVTVSNLSPSAGVSNGATFTVESIDPVLTWMTPRRVKEGRGPVTLTIRGANFVPQSQVRGRPWPMMTTYVSSTELRVTINTTGWLWSGRYPVWVHNPAPANDSATLDLVIMPEPGRPATFAVGGGQTCASDAFVAACAGRNDVRQLGTAETGDLAHPTTGDWYEFPRQISAGEAHTCILDAMSVLCAGANDYGQLGNGTRTSGGAITSPMLVETAVEVSAGRDHTCARVTGNAVRCWGRNTSGQVGNGSTATAVTRPTAVSTPALTQIVARGDDFTCGLATDATVWCWGGNAWGQLGTGDLVERHAATQVPGLSNVTMIDAHDGHVCALIADGSVRCWGQNDWGQLGDGTTSARALPGAVLGIDRAVAVSTGDRFSCAVLDDGGVHCWGRNVEGTLGDGTTSGTPVSSPVTVSGISSASSISSGSHTVVELADGTYRGWGPNTHGQFGDETTLDHAAPAPVFFAIERVEMPDFVAGYDTFFWLDGWSFEPGSVVRLGGVPLETVEGAYGYAGRQLGAAVPASLVQRGGTYEVTVASPPPDTRVTQAYPVTVYNRVPTLFAYTGELIAGSPDTEIELDGLNLVEGAVVSLNDYLGQRFPLATTVVSATHLRAIVPASLLVAPYEFRAVVSNPEPALGESSYVDLIVWEPARTISSVSPSTVLAGSPDVTITIEGTNFGPGDTVYAGSMLPVATTFVSDTELLAVIPASRLAAAGEVTIWVSNPWAILHEPTYVIQVQNAPPVLASLTPARVGASANALVVSIDGTGFVSGAQATFDGTDVATTFVSATRVTATIPAGLTSALGAHLITVANPAPTSGPSAPLALEVVNATPVLASVTPSSVAMGAPDTVVTLRGSSFVSGAVAAFDGAGLATTFVSATELQATIPAALLQAAGNHDLVVTNPSPTLGSSSARTFSVENPTPILSSLLPASATAPAVDFTLTVNGTGFLAGASITFDGRVLTTSYVSATQLTASVPAARVATGGNYLVTVTNPAPSTPSSALTFTCNNPAPTLSAISPNRATANGRSLTISLYGTNYVSTAHVEVDGTAVATTFVSATRLDAVVPGSLVATIRDRNVTVVTPTPGGGTSAARVLTVEAPNLTVGGYQECVRHGDGTGWCLGYNGFGALGDGTTTNRTSTVQISGLTNILQISSGTYHTCALLTDRTVRCWGWNTNGQLGDGTTTNRSLPVTITGISNVAEVAAGAYHTCARKTDGTIWCWGRNDYGQLGNSATTEQRVPVQVTGITTAVQVARPGWFHTCALLADGTVRCWGYNFYGTLGTGDTNTRTSPAQVAGLANVQSIVGGNYHNCAVLADGTPRCWGYNVDGQIGDGTRTNALTPVPVTNLSGVTMMSAGSYVTCATLADRTARCWGNNSEGSLGNGTLTGALTPVVVSGLTNADVLASGTYHSIAQLTDGTFRGWGSNTYGQVGDGTTTQRTTSVVATRLATTNPLPLLTSITPSSALAGAGDTIITVNGSSFEAGALVSLGATPLETTFVSATRLTAVAPAALLTSAPATYNLTVTNPAPTSGTSASLTFSVNNPAPTLASISPSSAIAGAADTIVTLTGSAFVAGAAATMNGTVLATTFVTSAQVTATIPASLLASAGTFNVTVSNPGSASSAAQTFTVNNAAPLLSSFTPATVTAGGAAFTLTLDGSSFVSGAYVTLAGAQLATTYVSSTSLTASVPASAITAAGYLTLSVSNPAPNLGSSVTRTLTVNNATPTLATVTPGSAILGAADLTVTIDGASFVSGAQASFDGIGLATTFVSATRLTAIVPTALLTASGVHAVVVDNPAPSNGPSAALELDVLNPTPVLTSLSVLTVPIGTDFGLTVSGSGFVPGARVVLGGVELATTYGSATSVSADVPGSALAIAGAYTVSVVNPTPAAGASNVLTFTALNPAPILASLAPAGATAGTAAFTLTVRGSGFLAGAIVSFGGAPLATTFVSVTEVTATVPAASVASAGNYLVLVTNPAPTVGASGPLGFAVDNPAPVLGAISPATANTGTGPLTITLTGSSFVSTSYATLDGSALSTNYLSATSLTAVVPATSLTAAGTRSITVVTPAPGGGTSAARTLNVVSPIIVPVTTIQASVETCAIGAGATARCAGFGGLGGLGNGTNTNSRTPVTVSNLTNVAEVGAGGNFACALQTGGAVWCWGTNAAGQLGNGSTTNTNVPVSTGITTATEISTAYQGQHSCARISDGTVRCWGGNAYGQVGNGGTTNVLTPTTVSGLTNVAAVSVGAEHSCALLTSGAVWCWGRATYGQLGDGGTTTRTTPVQVVGITNATQLTSGGYHACVRLADATMQCWGRNGDGQIGNGTTSTNVLTPTTVTGLTNVAQVSGGTVATCAVLTDGTARCWGNNASGQLGDGTTTSRTTPVALNGLTGLVEIRTGAGTTCARTTTNVPYCWGNNTNGQIGDGTVTNRLTPVLVSF